MAFSPYPIIHSFSTRLYLPKFMDLSRTIHLLGDLLGHVISVKNSSGERAGGGGAAGPVRDGVVKVFL
jgi:hypothetical protein